MQRGFGAWPGVCKRAHVNLITGRGARLPCGPCRLGRGLLEGDFIEGLAAQDGAFPVGRSAARGACGDVGRLAEVGAIACHLALVRDHSKKLHTAVGSVSDSTASTRERPRRPSAWSAQPPEQLSPWAIVAGHTLGRWALLGRFDRIGRGWRLGRDPRAGSPGRARPRT